MSINDAGEPVLRRVMARDIPPSAISLQTALMQRMLIRTIFLLNWIGSRELRQEVTANTNKIESYNGFSKWL
ncbi:Tn3 family transposase, partial [Pseudomonas aeruginosa]|uniref:Tn3 family transposase n=1 Tax=Pseudomonas aeruginosa TaxID=287 RepID=UPI003BF5193B